MGTLAARARATEVLCDGLGRIYALLLTGGQVHDIKRARALLASVTALGCLIGDKAYDANDVRAYLAAAGSIAVIPPMSTRRTPVPFDAELYRMRNVIERSFNRLKDWRAIATRYDKTARNFLAASASPPQSPTGCIVSTP